MVRMRGMCFIGSVFLISSANQEYSAVLVRCQLSVERCNEFSILNSQFLIIGAGNRPRGSILLPAIEAKSESQLLVISALSASRVGLRRDRTCAP